MRKVVVKIEIPIDDTTKVTSGTIQYISDIFFTYADKHFGSELFKRDIDVKASCLEDNQ